MPLGRVYGIDFEISDIASPINTNQRESDPFYRLGYAVLENAFLEWKNVTKKPYCDLSNAEILLYHDLLRFFNSSLCLTYLDIYMPNYSIDFIRSKLCIPKSTR